MKKLINFPNLLTIIRIAALPFLLYLIAKKHFIYGFIIFILSAFTDLLDGYLARKWNQQTKLGSMLDPLADKLLVVSLYLSFFFLGEPVSSPIPVWFIILLIIKEFLLITGALFMCVIKSFLPVKPTLLAKSLMVINSIFIVALFVQILTNFFNANFINFAYKLIAVLTILTFIQYLLIGLNKRFKL